MYKDIIFYAPDGKSVAPEQIGGAESGCMKTIKILRESGFRIIPLAKPVRKASVVCYAIRILSAWTKLLALLLVHRKATLHVVGCYRELMYVELAFILTTKILGHKTVYDIRNGDMIKEYEKRGNLYKRGMLALLNHSDNILCQGIDYVHFIKDKLGKSALYYPNYIQDRFMSDGYPQRDTQQCRLAYFGRIVPAKNIDVMLEIYRILHERGLSPTLDLIGGCSDSYKAELEDKIRKSGITGNHIRFWGRKEFEEFFPYLKTCHFFLFPSSDSREGHSNSLTEAMGCGIVPIVSDAGFNRQIVDENRLVISKSDAEIYAEIIAEIWMSKKWDCLSRKMYSRVAANFTENHVRETLLDAYL